jgi:hypothetical protein
MNCRRYQKWIPDAALGALAPAHAAELAAHAAACSGCREALERERQLHRALDRELTDWLRAEPSPQLAAAVRRRLAGHPAAAARGWRWIPITAGALAAAALVLWLIPRTVEAPPVAVEPPAPATQAAEIRPAEPAAPPEVPGRVRERERTARAAAPVEPADEVIVPPGQWQAAVQLYRASRSGRLDADSVVAEPTPLEARIADLRMSLLEIVPLEPEPGRDAPERGTAGRG